MSKVGVVTDSTNCLPTELVKEYGIGVAPVHFAIGGKDYRDQVDITSAEFWGMFKGLKEMPTTSGAGPGDFAGAFTELAKSTDNIACIVLSKALSATHGAAVQARELVMSENPNLNIEVVDSKHSVGGLGFVVLEAARAAKAGKSLAEVVKVAQDMVPRVRYFLVPDTLKYLMKIGRAPKSAVIGELLQVKPIIGMVSTTGMLENLGRVRTKQKAMSKIVSLVKEYTDTDKPVHVIVHYSDHIQDGEQLREMVTANYNCTEVYVTEFSPVAGAAMGPAVGLAFYS